MGQFGNTADRWGRRFVCDNRNHLRHVVFPSEPRHPLLPARPLLHDTAGPADGPLSSGAQVFPISPAWTTSNLHAGRFTAACGVFIDSGSLLPAPFAGAAFTCEPTGNLIHAETLTPHGATFRSAPWKPGVEFVASTDETFRPVSLTSAPDGALIVTDMARAVIEHPEFMPQELKTRPDLLHGADRGRIWRIAPEGNKPGAAPTLKLSTGELVLELGSSNGWRRATAQRLLLTRPDAAAPLEAFARQTASPEGLILAAWLLKPCPAVVLARLAAHEHPRVREQAVRLLELTGDAASFKRFVTDTDARVRFQAALSLGTCRGDVVPALARIALQDAADPWIRLAIAGSSAGCTATLLAMLLADPAFTINEDRLAFVRELADLVGAGRDAVEIKIVIDALAAREPPWQRAVLTGLAEGVARRGGTLLATGPAARAMLEAATKPAADSTASEPERLAAVRLLAHAPWPTAAPVLASLLESDSTPLRAAAVRAVAVHSQPEVPALIVKAWRGATPAVRAEVLDALTGRPDRAAVLLDAVAAGTIKPTDINPLRARRLIASKDAAVAARAAKLLRESLPADRTAALAAYHEALKIRGDIARGRAIFGANCAACHRVDGLGTAVGPDISDTRTKTAAMLLADILTPNAAIDGNFIAYTAILKNGQTHSGVVAAESAAAITLKSDGNRSVTLLRTDLDELKSSGLSLMPDGLEKTISHQQMADLLRFLKDWRQSPAAK